MNKDKLIKEIEERIKTLQGDRSTSTAPTNARDLARFQGVLGGLAEAIEIIKAF